MAGNHPAQDKLTPSKGKNHVDQPTTANRTAPGSLINVAIQAIVLALIVNLLILYVTNGFANGNIIDPNTGDEMPFIAVIVATIA